MANVMFSTVPSSYFGSGSSGKTAKAKRALVLQGGGALGAYEAGAFMALYEQYGQQNKSDYHGLFDIVAGTSIGAINAAILVSYVTNNKNRDNDWEGSHSFLKSFWDYLASSDILGFSFWPGENEGKSWPTWMAQQKFLTYDLENLAPFNNPAFRMWSNLSNSWWSLVQQFTQPLLDLAPLEAMRSYWTNKIAEYIGIPTVFVGPLFSFPPFLPDTKYFDYWPIPNLWIKYNPYNLQKSFERYCPNPIRIAKEPDPKDPRLIIVSTDIAYGAPMVFDSYLGEAVACIYVNGQPTNPYTINYKDSGITSDHVMASASVPINYPPVAVQANGSPKHYLWDGGLLSNTPLDQLLQQHYNYYFERVVAELGGLGKLEPDWWDSFSGVPDLEQVVMINVNPTTQITNTSKNGLDILPSFLKPPPEFMRDHDGAIGRCTDITLADKTNLTQGTLASLDEFINIVVSYRDLVVGLINKFASTPNPVIKALKDFVSSTAPYTKGVSGIGLARLNQIHETILGSVLAQADQNEQVKQMTEAVLKQLKDDPIVLPSEPTDPFGLIYNPRGTTTTTKYEPYTPKTLPIYYTDLASFRVNNFLRIERQDDINDISGKLSEFSKSTIWRLREQGYNDACNALQIIDDKFQPNEKTRRDLAAFPPFG
jgi:NTE family protein